MERYRITFQDNERVIINAGSLHQAIASAVRYDKHDREIIKVEKWEHISNKEQTNDKRSDG
jgi:hypothetical protein